MGQWSGLATFPVPVTGQWPRHGHLRGILDGFQGRQPNFHKWARPAYEQGALPTLSLLPGEVVIKVLPGDKIYQAMEIEPGFMRPAILHGLRLFLGQQSGSRSGSTTTFSQLSACVSMRRFHRPRSHTSNKWRCSVCGNEALQLGLSVEPLSRPLTSHLASQPCSVPQRIGQ